MRADPARRERAAEAFTLLEVLAAVAILGILYATLARVGAQGMRSEATSRTRLEASLLADQRLAELETQVAAGSIPPVGRSEEELGEFVVTTEVEAYELPKPPTPEGTVNRTPSAPEAPGIFDLATAISEDGEPLLRKIQLSVVWEEFGAERKVLRTTYAFDLEAVANLVNTDEGGQLPDPSQLPNAPELPGAAQRGRR